MAVSSRVVAILGAGPNVGNKVAERFTAAGYKVAVISRSGKSIPTTIAALSLIADFTNPKTVHGVFEEVREKLGEPSVVVYNAYASGITPPASDVLSVDLETFQNHLAINTTSTFAAAQEAVRSFDAISDEETPRTFIYTGNICNQAAFLPFLTLGVGKAASSHMLDLASKSYVDKGYRFYYADERTPEGNPTGTNVDGNAHAEFYYKLANKKEQGEYIQTFVKGKGYVRF